MNIDDAPKKTPGRPKSSCTPSGGLPQGRVGGEPKKTPGRPKSSCTPSGGLPQGRVEGRPSYEAAVVVDMEHWLEQAVIGLQLCPFAKSVHVRGQIHYVVTRASEPDLLLAKLAHAMQELVAMEPAQRDTTLLVMPDALTSFQDFNDFLFRADALLAALDLDGVLQLASFHPQFQFAGTRGDDIGNATNRAPYPTLHVLREASLDHAVAAFPQAESIFEANIETMQRLGQAGWDALGIRRSVPEVLQPTAAPAQRRSKIRR